MNVTKRTNRPLRGATVVYANVVGQLIGERIRLDRRRRRLSAVVKRHAIRGRAYIVSVHRPGEILRPEDHTLVAREEWAKTLVSHDSVVLITYLPAGPGGSGSSTGKQVGAALGLLALSLAAPYAVGAIAAAGVPGLVTATGALTFGGSVLAR